jgi:8-oxo-dGTP pyrophosphatase MutT (NUDIX family)
MTTGVRDAGRRCVCRPVASVPILTARALRAIRLSIAAKSVGRSVPISSYLKSVREKVGHDLLMMTAVSISIFDAEGRLLLGRDSEMDRWSLPGGGVDPNEQPADAAVRECFEETGLLVRLDQLIGVFGGPEFLIHYPNGDVTYYTTAAFRGTIVGGAHAPMDGEFSELGYFSRSDCDSLDMSPSSRIISSEAFAAANQPYFAPATWTPEKAD